MKYLTYALLIFSLSCSSSPAEEDVIYEHEICCDDKCGAPEGMCCFDGTCNGNHKEMPIDRK